MVSMGVSKLGRIDLIFINAAVKINGVTLTCFDSKAIGLLPAVRDIRAVFFTFQQCNAPAAAAHRACTETTNLLE